VPPKLRVFKMLTLGLSVLAVALFVYKPPLSVIYQLESLTLVADRV